MTKTKKTTVSLPFVFFQISMLWRINVSFCCCCNWPVAVACRKRTRKKNAQWENARERWWYKNKTNKQNIKMMLQMLYFHQVLQALQQNNPFSQCCWYYPIATTPFIVHMTFCNCYHGCHQCHQCPFSIACSCLLLSWLLFKALASLWHCRQASLAG